ncbi:hypothetical protein SAMN05428974_0511 [Sphingopyxis sp. YR583]|uniref:hypothetical protein n=1 Tax=Sphingopyxis sp. YR583 TaxID=1881047 RepID=UPI0008A80CFD|nr:hypothetical protein [Sphingopyxis sp. YR583]SEH12585.1 hypothetical protein SAMN05428974_0511 [Sphingopyxis sp. YR583]
MMGLRLSLMTLVMAFGVGCSEVPPRQAPEKEDDTLFSMAATERSVNRELERMVQPKGGGGEEPEPFLYD